MSSVNTSGKAVFVNGMFASIAKRYDLMNSVLSLGVHLLWKRKVLGMARDARPLRALDLCTGTGDLLVGLAKFTNEVVGADFCTQMLQQADSKLKSFKNVRLVVADALDLKFADQSFDLVTIAFGVRNFENLDQGLREVARVLKPGGRVIILEFGQPSQAWFRYLYNLYSRLILPLLGRLIAGNASAYNYLRQSAAVFPCRDQFLEILLRCGFNRGTFCSLTGGIAYIYSANTLIEK